MADEEAPPEFMSALVTEHFALQSAASSTISESGNRVAIYLSALSGGLVAIGFASSSPHALAAGQRSRLERLFHCLSSVMAVGRTIYRTTIYQYAWRSCIRRPPPRSDSGCALIACPADWHS